MRIINVNVEEANIRIDKYLIKELKLSRSSIQKLIKDNKITVNDQVIKNNYIVRVDDEIMVDDINEEPTKIEPENIPLDILFEDDSIIVLNKPSGMVVHPAAGHYTNTLVNALLYYSPNLSSNDVRPGIVHRIDKDTSGLLLVAKNDEVHSKLSESLKERTIIRRYIALVEGMIKPEKGTIDAPIGRDPFDRKKMAVTDLNAKKAITHFRVLERFNEATLIECQLETGRTHQIRLHMHYIGHPVINDVVYNNRKPINSFGQMLHAKFIGLKHPLTDEYMEFEAETPAEFNEILDIYR